ncbi:MAG: hypothetical protein L6V95_03310 [Candidatus Melainabacteria bacterium]|nr:MAG: hypothetical protein L6V95_03310 [Candidatus Melainabacteria bacterium]
MKLKIMKNTNFKIFILALYLIFFIQQAFSYDIMIDPTRNGIKHNNKGIMYMQEGYLPQAIKRISNCN